MGNDGLEWHLRGTGDEWEGDWERGAWQSPIKKLITFLEPQLNALPGLTHSILAALPLMLSLFPLHR